MWLSGEIILSDLSLRIRPDFETSRGLCGLAQNSAHRVPATTNVLRRLRLHTNPTTPAIKLSFKNRTSSSRSVQPPTNPTRQDARPATR
ncbi:hypothetical protein [Lapidilactobacillus salsurivasis]